MDEQYRFFAASHLYLGVELAAGLIIMGIYTDAGQYFGRTWSLWLASISFIASPFWFNPLTFDWNMVTSDYGVWVRWIRGTSGGASKSWSMWYNEENAFYSKLLFSSKLLFILKAALLFLVADGIWKSQLFRSDVSLSNPIIKVSYLLIIVICLLILRWLVSAQERSIPYPVRRTIGILVAIGVVAAIITLFIEDSNYLRYALAGYYGMGAICMIGLLFGFKFVKVFYCIHDIVCAHIIFIPLFVLAALQLPGQIQTWLLYHNALSANVVVSDILRYARKTKDSGGAVGGEANEDLMDQVNELKKIVHRQEKLLESMGLAVPSSDASNAGLMPAISAESDVQESRTGGSNKPGYGRAVSMSGMDVWSEMALGDVGEIKGQGEIAPARTTQPVPHTSAAGFSFSQPDTMPPR
jgi:callose synthase